jgi:hypothetical protein
MARTNSLDFMYICILSIVCSTLEFSSWLPYKFIIAKILGLISISVANVKKLSLQQAMEAHRIVRN